MIGAFCLAFEQAQPRVTRASGENQSDPARRSLVKGRQESQFVVSRLRPSFFTLTATLLSLVLQREPARRLFLSFSRRLRTFHGALHNSYSQT